MAFQAVHFAFFLSNNEALGSQGILKGAYHFMLFFELLLHHGVSTGRARLVQFSMQVVNHGITVCQGLFEIRYFVRTQGVKLIHERLTLLSRRV